MLLIFRAGLLLATTMCVLLSSWLNRHVEAGGKGKGGRQGHIIIQNEIKGHRVPVYMPIPIPIPMPMGPPPGAKFPHPSMGHHQYQQQQHQQQQIDEGEPEVKKIYLLQPMPKIQPQPQLKGGGFMGHTNYRPRQAPKMSHHHSGGYGDSTGGDMGQMEQAPASKGGGGGGGGGGGDVKILPIVVIPSMAPLPPVQMSTTSGGHYQQPKMTLTPQFNNYIVSSGERKRMMSSNHHATQGQRARHHDHSNFADYGGSVGGSVFRENYPGRSRSSMKSGRNSQLQQFEAQASRSSRSRDYDYGDSDYDSSSSPSRSLNNDYQYQSGPHTRTTSQRRNYRPTNNHHHHHHQNCAHQRSPSSSSSSSGSFQQHADQNYAPPTRVNSIRDIVEQQATQFDDDLPLNQDPYGDITNDELAPARFRSQHQRNHHQALDLELNELDLEPVRESRLSRVQTTDVSSPEEIDREPLSTQTSHQRNHMRSNQDLSYLYYDREPSQQNNHHHHHHHQTTTTRLGGSSSDVPTSRTRPRASRLAYPDERDLYDEDEWRFDSIKSVAHVGVNDTMTNNVTATTTTITTTNNTTTIPTISLEPQTNSL